VEGTKYSSRGACDRITACNTWGVVLCYCACGNLPMRAQSSGTDDYYACGNSATKYYCTVTGERCSDCRNLGFSIENPNEVLDLCTSTYCGLLTVERGPYSWEGWDQTCYCS